VLALVFLLFRPQGLFGEKIIDRVWNTRAIIFRRRRNARSALRAGTQFAHSTAGAPSCKRSSTAC